MHGAFAKSADCVRCCITQCVQVLHAQLLGDLPNFGVVFIRLVADLAHVTEYQ